MANKTYYLKFGSGDPRSYSGLSPTFVLFSLGGITAQIGPTITEMPNGSGMYQFGYGPTMAVNFIADAGSALQSPDRFVTGVLDPVQAVDQQLGFSTDSFGSTGADPTTIWGYCKRFLELFEGDAVFTKATGVWQLFNRGSSTLLRTKTVTNNPTSASKTGL